MDKYNSEGYYDPTAYQAITLIESQEHAYRPLVYICSPYAGNVAENTTAARRYCRFAAAEGVIPIAPHLLFPQFLNDHNPAERRMGKFFGMVLMSKCREVWVFGDQISPGMAAEIKRAKRKNYAIRYFTMEFEEEHNHELYGD